MHGDIYKTVSHEHRTEGVSIHILRNAALY